MIRNKIIAPIEDYKHIIYSGCAIESNGVSICNLSDYLNRPSGRGADYQVWSDRHRCYDLYYNIEDAVNKFLELKNKG